MSKPTYRAVEVVQANGPLKMVERELRNPGLARSAYASMPAACVTATP